MASASLYRRILGARYDELPEVAANLAFADEGRTVYITASTSIYRLPVATAGEMPIYSSN